MIGWTLVFVLTAAPYDKATRVSRLEAILEAEQRTPKQVLADAYRYVAVYERSSCASASQRLRAECLVTAAERFCQKRPQSEAGDCALYLDVVVSNLLAEKELIPSAKRYDIMRTSPDWRKEMAAQLHRMQGALAVEFELKSDRKGGLAPAIDAFCASSDDDVHLSWQICATSLLWFIGANAPETEKKSE